MPIPILLGVVFGLALAPPPPTLPPSGAAVRGERQARQAAASERQSMSPEGLGLSAQADGGFLYVDPGKRFKARIGSDGSVTFADRWRRPARRRRGSKRERGTVGGTPAGGMFDATNVLAGAPVSGPTEWGFAIRRRDPNAAAKANFLTRTASLRTGLAVNAMRRQMRSALDSLEDSLQRLWEDSELPVAAKRAIVFRRWDGLAEPPPRAAAASELDRLRASYGRRARARVEAFIRRTLPKGSAAGYSTAELSRLNAVRQSTRPFTPYRPQETNDG